jgi:hypothetical protein
VLNGFFGYLSVWAGILHGQDVIELCETDSKVTVLDCGGSGGPVRQATRRNVGYIKRLQILFYELKLTRATRIPKNIGKFSVPNGGWLDMLQESLKVGQF